MSKPISVVIVGPMGSEKVGQGQIPVTDHMKNIAVAINRCTERFVAEGKPWVLAPVWAEKIPGGAISPFVLLHLDQAEIAVADISLRSPSVFYEIAILHALGRPTILLDYKSGAGNPPFYLKGQLIKGVTDFSADELTSVLMETFVGQADDGGYAGVWANAITDFYTVPLVDASAVSGLATGYFVNFARRIIADGHGVLARMSRRPDPETRGITHLGVIKPTSIQQLDQARLVIEKLPGFYRGRKYKDDDFSRDFIFDTVGPYIVDYPTTLESMQASPSFLKMQQLLTQAYPLKADEVLQKMQERIISTFCTTVFNLAQTTHGTNPSRLKFLTVDELSNEIMERVR